jgi:hypothetical protein
VAPAFCVCRMCPCEGRPLEVPNPATTQIHPHRDVWWSTARPFGHPWVLLSASLGQPTMHFWVFGSRPRLSMCTPGREFFKRSKHLIGVQKVLCVFFLG